jgi:hypothetical protein
LLTSRASKAAEKRLRALGLRASSRQLFRFFYFPHLKRLMQQSFEQLLGGLLVGDDVFF